MKMVVCVKQVIDPETPPSSFKVDYTTNRVLQPLTTLPVLDPYGENAVEAALRIKDTMGGDITVLSMGNNFIQSVVKKPLSMGADRLILLEDDGNTEADSWSTAYALAMAIRKIGGFDLILCGWQSSETNAGQVGSGIAFFLGVPCITVAKKIIIANGKAKIERLVDDGTEVVEVFLPVVITVSGELGDPRYPSIKGILAAKKIDPIIWKPGDIGAEASKIDAGGIRLKLLRLFQPIRNSKCEIIEAESSEEAGIKLALKLRRNKII
jgi:electron transfer flavoprotein beta subunit